MKTYAEPKVTHYPPLYSIQLSSHKMLSRLLFQSFTPLAYQSTAKCSLNVLKSNFSSAKILELNNLHTIPGAFKKVIIIRTRNIHMIYHLI